MRRRGTTAALAATVLLTGGATAWAALTPEGSAYPTGTDPYTLAVADFNGDGRPDVATANGTSGTVSVFLRGAGGFAEAPGSPFPAGAGPSNAAVGDFDRDGLLDLAVADYTGSTVTVLRGQPGGGFAQEGSALSVSGSLSWIVSGDFDRDGTLELAVARQGAGAVSVLVRNSTNTGFTLGRGGFQTGPAPGPIAEGFFNDDPFLDLAVVNTGTGANSVTVALGDGAGGFTTPEPTVPTGDRPYGVFAADFTGDGRADLAVSNYGAGTVSVFDRNAAGTGFTEEPGSPVAVSANPAVISFADFDRDGLTDAAVAANSGAVDILRRNPGGFFTLDSAIPLAGFQNGVAAGDFDGDGRPDLAVSEISANTATPSALRVLLNPAPAAPPTPTPTPTPTATPTPLPPPVAGKTVNAARKSGTVRFRRPGAKKFVTLTADAQIPVGSVIDTRRGRITITAAQGKGRTASADFFDGLFKLTQTKGKKPATTLKLTEKLRCPRRAKASIAAKKKPKSRRLWGSGHGRFTTKGAYSAATVRGTKWLVQDTCRTTTTRVAAGVVSVRDFVKRKTVLLRKGKRYVARRR